MGHVFHPLYYHFAWATHAREPHLNRSYRSQLLQILNGRLSQLLETTEGEEEETFRP